MSLPPLYLQGSLSEFSSLGEGFLHGDLLAGKVAGIEPDGRVLISLSGGAKALADPTPALRVGDFVVACVQRSGLGTRLLLLPEVKLGETITGTLVSSGPARGLIKFGEAELRIRLEAESPLPEQGAAVRGRLLLQAGKPVLELVAPRDSGNIFAGAPSVSEGDTGLDPALRQVLELLSLPQVEGILRDSGIQEAAAQTRIHALLSLLLGLPKSFSADRPWLDALLTALEAAHLDPATEGLAEQLASASENSGLFFESKLLRAALLSEHDPSIQNDLKFLLFQALERLSDIPSKEAAAVPMRQMSEEAARLLDTVRGEQLLNLRLLPMHQLYVQLPLADSAGLNGLEILISPQKERKSRRIDPANVVLTLALSTSKLGRVKVSISVVGGRMTCQFRTDRRWVADLIEENADALKRGLEKLRYSVLHIGCVLAREEGELSLAAEILASEPGGINIRI